MRELENYVPLTEEEIAKLWGGPLPELEPEYIEMGKEYAQGRPELAPYMMKKVFTPDDARLAMALPGTAEEVAEKMGMDVETTRERLLQMTYRGKILADDQEVFSRHNNLGNFKDWVYAQEKYDCEYDRNAAIIMDAWDYVGDAFFGLLPGTTEKFMRIVPKWESIKDIPGVMPCENMPEMLRNDDTVAFTRCPCRAVTSIVRYGEIRPDMCRTGLKEGHTPKEGLCMLAQRRSAYFTKYLDAYHPTKEELEQRIREIEAGGGYYSIFNAREFGGLCNCCDDCKCGIRAPYELGDEDFYEKSRFLAYMDEEESCIGCGACEEICPFKKSVRVVDGIAVVDEDRCHGCGNCVTHCPTGAIKMKLVRPASHILPVVERLKLMGEGV